MRVLIAYGSRYGSTEEIAHKIAEYLAENSIEATVVNVKKEKKWPLFDEYDGVIVGSGIKISKWMREPKIFLEKRAQELKKMKLAVYISCISIINDPEYTRKELLEKVFTETNVKPDLYEAFGPLIDMSSSSKMGFIDKIISKTVITGLNKDLNLNLDMNGRNDLRDWEKIREFTNKFIEIIEYEMR